MPRTSRSKGFRGLLKGVDWVIAALFAAMVAFYALLFAYLIGCWG